MRSIVFVSKCLLASGILLLVTATVASPSTSTRTRLLDLWRTGAFSEAELAATSVLEGLGSGSSVDSLLLADASFVLGEALARRGAWDDPRLVSSLERAYEIRRRKLSADDADVGIAAMTLAEVLAMGFDPRAMDLASSALDIFLRAVAPVDSLLATAWIDVGQCRAMFLGDLEGAVSALRTGLDLRVRAFGASDRRTALAWMVLGDGLAAMGDLDAARDAFRGALDIYERTRGVADLERAGPLSRLLALETDAGDLATAVELAHEHARLVEMHGDRTESFVSYSNLAALLQHFGDYPGARAASLRAQEFESAISGSASWLLGAQRQVLGAARLGMGQTKEARADFEQAIAILRANPSPETGRILASALAGHAEAAFVLGELETARASCEAAVMASDDAAVVDRRLRVTTRALLVRILAALGDRRGVERIYDELLEFRARGGIDTPATAHVLSAAISRVAAALDHDDEAWTLALRAHDEAREFLALNVVALPESRALELRRHLDGVQSAMLDLAGPEHPERWDAAWDRIIRGRAAIRAAWSARRIPKATMDDAVRAAHTEWVAAQRVLARSLVVEPMLGAPVEGETWRAAAEDARLAETRWARALDAQGSGSRTREVGRQEVLARLGTDEALVSFVQWDPELGPSQILAFVGRGDGSPTQRVDLGDSDALRRVIDRWRATLSRPPRDEGDTRAVHDAGVEVRRAIWDPIMATVARATTIDVVADGPVLGLPWHALPIDATRFLVELELHVSTPQAERDLLDLPLDPGTALFALGDPEFSASADPNGSPMIGARGEPCASQGLERLPGAEEEARAVARLWAQRSGATSKLFLGARATESVFRASAPGSAVVHLATHGVMSDALCQPTPSQSRGVGGVSSLEGAARAPAFARSIWLALAREAGAADDGLLTAEEVVTLDFEGTDWVVLSACHSGLATAWSGEGNVGMARAFRLAGARNVFTSEWAVDDESTVEWMHELYRARAAGSTRASDAHRAACRAVLDSRRLRGSSTHPFHWAAFVVDGR